MLTVCDSGACQLNCESNSESESEKDGQEEKFCVLRQRWCSTFEEKQVELNNRSVNMSSSSRTLSVKK